MRTISAERAQQALDAYVAHGHNKARAARALGVANETVTKRLRKAEELGLAPSVGGDPSGDVKVEFSLREKIRSLEHTIGQLQKNSLKEDAIREAIIGLNEATEDTEPPEWLVEIDPRHKSGPGVPTLFASDWHWGEIVDPSQINGVNEYNMDIASDRARQMIESTVDICFNHMVEPKYPGMVFILGGDMVTGDIHEELTATNEMEIMPTFVDLHSKLTWCIETLAERFGRVFVPCVTGNHGRNTQKIRSKGRNATSFDWLLYCMLQKKFEGDKRVQFHIPNGPDAHYQIFGRRYLLTHGDQFRGGDGVIGPLGPIIRGDHRKRTRNNQVGMEYDTLLLGHWHQLIQLNRLIVNGSLKGYDEYANQNNFPYEPPQQALWFTHPKRGITSSWPVHVSDGEEAGSKSWIGWKND